MSALENAVRRLADALDKLESGIEERRGAADKGALDEAAQTAEAARAELDAVDAALSVSIDELRALLKGDAVADQDAEGTKDAADGSG